VTLFSPVGSCSEHWELGAAVPYTLLFADLKAFVFHVTARRALTLPAHNRQALDNKFLNCRFARDQHHATPKEAGHL
jgi:hypothetical protein